MPFISRVYRSLRVRMIALVTLVFVAIYLIAFYFARDFIDSSNYELAKQLISQQTKLTRERTLSFFDRDIKLIETGIERGLYQDWMRDSQNETFAQNAIENLHVNCRLVNCFGWFIYSQESKDGYVFNNEEKQTSKIKLEDYDMVWYQPLLKSGKTTLIDSNYDEGANIQSVFLDYVVRDSTGVLGVVGTYIQLDDILDILLTQEEQGISNFFIDEKRTLRFQSEQKIRSDSAALYEQLANKNWQKLVSPNMQERLNDMQANLDDSALTQTVAIDNAEYLMAVGHIEQVEWFAVSLYPLNRQHGYFDVVPIFVVSLCILVLFIFISIAMLNQQVFKPVNTLNKVVDDIHDGHYKVNVGDLGTDIIQNLGNRITEMAEQISTQIEQLETSNEALQETSEKALKASTAKSLFLSNMSHEIRTPLNAILGTLQLLERDKLTQEQTNLVIRSLYSARTLMTIINDILDYSKIEANELVLEKTEFELQQVVDSIQSDLAATALLKGINLQCHIEQRFNDGWLGDPVRVRQVILNLVSNAVKFTEQGGVTVNISHVSVDQGEGVYVEVIDTGIGMTEEEQQKIGTRFTQADSSTTRKFGGTGLGMAITLNLVNLMGGNLIIESQTGKGTKIGVRLPLEKTDLKLTDISNENVSIPRMEHSRILLAEDNEINQEILQAMLQPSGCRLDIVENGAAAVEALKINDYDLVLMDIQMPVMDGVVAFETIRRFNVQIPIIALTANVMSDDVQRYNDLGFNAYIGKPIDMNLLYSTLDKFVPHCRKRA